MARITLFRHGKAEAPSLQQPDFDRALTTRGIANARRMGAMITEQRMLPDLVLVSPAMRCRQTYEMASEFWPDIPMSFEDGIFEANASTLLDLIAAKAPSMANILVIGHNPGLVVLLNYMAGSAHTDGNLSYFPTSCVADIGFEAPTIDGVTPDEGRLLSMIRVRDLSDE